MTGAGGVGFNPFQHIGAFFVKHLYAVIFSLSLAVPAQAEQLELVCRGQGLERGMVPLKIDLESKNAIWGVDSAWRVVNYGEKYITIRRAEHQHTLGGMYWVIDRFSGEFVQGYVGMMSQKGDGTDSRLDGYILRGLCNKRKF